MTTTQNTDTLTSARLNASRELHLALVRYERLSSTPRWLILPVCTDPVKCMARAKVAAQRGNIEGAESWYWYANRELQRQAARNAFLGRSERAWRALFARMSQALEWAVRVGAVTHAGEVQFVEDRVRAVAYEVQRFETERKLARLN
jgi:hypothetical protein